MNVRPGKAQSRASSPTETLTSRLPKLNSSFIYCSYRESTVYICKRFLLSFLLLQLHKHFFFFFCSCRALHLKWPKKYKHICTCITAFNVYSITASRNCSWCTTKMSFKVQTVQLFIDILHAWAILTNQSSFTHKHQHLRYYAVVHSTAHWWLWSSSHLLCVDIAWHSLKCYSCCLWTLQRTYGVYNVQIFQMKWIMQNGRWISTKGFFTALVFFIRSDESMHGFKFS